MHVLFVERSRNAKIGSIPATYTEAKSCPSTCPLKDNGCYAKGGHVRMAWDRAKRDGITWAKLCARITKLATGQLWRHNVAGDLPHKNNVIDVHKMRMLINANRGKRGFTYTHHVTPDNHDIIKECNDNGFIVNLSANTFAEVDAYARLKIAPVVTILPENSPRTCVTPDNHVIKMCPQVYTEGLTCDDCQWCAMPNRWWVVGFPVHGVFKRLAEAIATIKGECHA